MKRSFCIYVSTILFVLPILACGPYDRYFLASEHCMFRLFGDNMEGSYSLLLAETRCRENCEEWAKITSSAIPLEDIEEVVYRWSREQVSSLRNGGKHCKNAFACWLVEHNDTEIIDFLVLAKQCELIRARQNTLWYYHVDGEEESDLLKKIIGKAQAYMGKRLKDRYLLQTVRALFADCRFEECIYLWEKSKNEFHAGVIKDLVVDYIVGAYERIGDRESASKIYLDRRKQELQLLCDIQNKIYNMERWGDSNEYTPIYQDVLYTIKKKQYREWAKWYYIQAFLADKLGKQQEAIWSISKAKSCAEDNETKDVVRILELYLKSKYAKIYNVAFENYLYGELLWLDSKITDGLTLEIEEKIRNCGSYNHICGYNLYYWNDIMRKIIIGNVVPLCIKSNYKTRALQYLNMADNCIFNKVPKKALYYKSWDKPDTTLTWSEYRLSEEFENGYDYINDFFINLDSIGVKYVKRLAYRIGNPICPLDKFLNKNSYTDRQYLYDIIGTQLIASGRYNEAIQYLSRVSKQFQCSRNVVQYFEWDPFYCDKKLKETNPLYKLHFAQEMCRLEYEMHYVHDPNIRAESMLRYARGMQNSVGEYCWALTSYYWGVWEPYPFYSQYQRRLIGNLLSKSEKLKSVAFALFTDEERAAKAYQDWCMWKSAAIKYPNTKTSQYIRRHCDNLVDYQLSPTMSPGFYWKGIYRK